MELKLKIHETEFSIKTEHDDFTIEEMYQFYESLLIGATFQPVQIENYIKDKADEIKMNK
jgi:coproporphyrinogen III oxidase-like Fe-S oxidoreductase